MREKDIPQVDHTPYSRSSEFRLWRSVLLLTITDIDLLYEKHLRLKKERISQPSIHHSKIGILNSRSNTDIERAQLLKHCKHEWMQTICEFAEIDHGTFMKHVNSKLTHWTYDD